MRALPILTVVLLAACSCSHSRDAADQTPSLAVAQAAMSSGAPQMALQVCAATAQRDPKNLDALVC
jgi:hypothetical protein